ncbi:hypothetical protein [Streptomyces sp. NBC_00454]|uniref:hypothetical protein n=1 Tax=Streptomyces sp. NBC_00454 TaxID=2975747 RepID=UPI003250AF08
MRVFVDTNVLFPFSVMDLMLALTEDSVHQVVWSERLLAEWERVIVREGRRSAADYAPLVHRMPGGDPDDRYHAAAACAAGADALITWNLADFPAADMARLGVRVLDPDTYLCELHALWPQEVSDTLAKLAAGKRNPPLTPDDVLARLGKAGLTRFADRLAQTGDP